MRVLVILYHAHPSASYRRHYDAFTLIRALHKVDALIKLNALKVTDPLLSLNIYKIQSKRRHSHIHRHTRHNL